MGSSDAAGGLVRRTAWRLLQKADKERSGVISTAQSHTHFLDSPRMTVVLGPSDVDRATLKRGLNGRGPDPSHRPQRYLRPQRGADDPQRAPPHGAHGRSAEEARTGHPHE